ncbi:hypothetical protein RND71_029468 [Anisodus tanguticus]|uniref:Uncharacterized protein n=1 Tax=Anisodus tanguticus TaxID=243964 RepID=A0AAE1V790_9SOLA|nr:hypothetical protein RND71_029468 [Anisodus tanguticus]
MEEEAKLGELVENYGSLFGVLTPPIVIVLQVGILDMGFDSALPELLLEEYNLVSTMEMQVMQPPHQHSRVSLVELKAQLVRKLGPERFKQYFYYLNRLLNLKISKVEFNKLCLRILGRENIPLHNQFIRSILRNACSAKVPPPTHETDVLKPGAAVGSNESPNDAYEQNGSHVSSSQASSQPGLSNGDILPLSPRKARTGYRDCRTGDRGTALGQNGKTNLAFQQPTATESSFDVMENGDTNPPDARRCVQHYQGLLQQADDEREASGQETARFSVIKRSQEGPISDDGKEMHARSQLQAPLGVPFFPVSVGGARKALPLATNSRCVTSSSYGALLDSVSLRERMEQIGAEQGLEGVAIGCANLLNNGLDSYLRGLIRSCVQLVGARSGHEPIRSNTRKQQTHMKLVNGLRPGHHSQISSGRPSEVMQEHGPNNLISLQDFRVAMELNSRQLGEDWPLLLEKIWFLCSRSITACVALLNQSSTLENNYLNLCLASRTDMDIQKEEAKLRQCKSLRQVGMPECCIAALLASIGE